MKKTTRNRIIFYLVLIFFLSIILAYLRVYDGFCIRRSRINNGTKSCLKHIKEALDEYYLKHKRYPENLRELVENKTLNIQAMYDVAKQDINILNFLSGYYLAPFLYYKVHNNTVSRDEHFILVAQPFAVERLRYVLVYKSTNGPLKDNTGYIKRIPDSEFKRLALKQNWDLKKSRECINPEAFVDSLSYNEFCCAIRKYYPNATETSRWEPSATGERGGANGRAEGRPVQKFDSKE